jgi:hypothetical protein
LPRNFVPLAGSKRVRAIVCPERAFIASLSADFFATDAFFNELFLQRRFEMNRPILASAFFVLATCALGAQQSSSSNPYQGTSAPPADDAIVATDGPQAKPQAGKPAAAPVQQDAAPQPSSVDPSVNNPDSGTAANDSSAPATNTTPNATASQPVPATSPDTTATAQPVLSTRTDASADPDGDIVHPAPLGPGEIGEGTMIRVRLLDRLSTVDSTRGEAFRSQVASDVLASGQVVIPAGAEIDGKVVQVTNGNHLGGHGSMRLLPETVILSDGSRYQLHAEVSGTPGSKTRMGSEGAINPGSRVKRDGVEYGGAVTAGVVTGALVGGPVGAVTGGVVGAGIVTTHLLMSHPQATLEPGSVLLFTLTDRLSLTPANPSGN